MPDLFLHLLGPPHLRVQEEVLPIKTRKSLALMAYLALEGPTPREALSHLLWPDLAPDTARHNLRQELYRLTRTPLGAHLRVDPVQVGPQGSWSVDVSAFEQALERQALEQALALYGGTLLEGVILENAEPFTAWLALHRERLHTRWQTAVLEQAQQREQSGDLRGALEAHLRLLQEDPLQERLEREAIRLHGLLGERERALERYQAFADLLAQELGLEPLPETRQAAEAARRGTVAPPRPAAPDSPPKRLHPPLIGRSGAWLALEGSTAPLTLITGEPGLGKSRLALAFAASYGTPLVLRAQEVAQGTPLYPLADALRGALTEPRARRRFEALDPAWRAEVGRLLPELGGPQEASPLEGRARFLEGLAQALFAVAGPEGAIVFEDLHWLDASTLELLAHLTRRVRTLERPPRLLATARAEDLEGSAAQPALAGLRRDEALHVVPLTPLSEEEVCSLVHSLSGGTEARRFARRLHQSTGGNPLFVLETLRFLFEAGELHDDASGWSTRFDAGTQDYAELPLPPQVREAVLARLRSVSPEARRLLDAASVGGAVFTLEDLAPAVALPEWEALDALEALTRLSLLEPRPQGFAFGHDLLRRAVASELSPERRRLLHRRFAATLEARGGPPARIAEHLEASGQPAEARTWRVRAAEAASAVFALPEALLHLAAALEGQPDDADAFAWRLRRADLLHQLGDPQARQAELEALEVLAERLGDPQRLAEVQVRWAVLHDDGGRYPEALEAAGRALAHPDLPGELRAWALYAHGAVLRRLGRLTEAEADQHAVLALEGISAARRAAAHDVLTHCALASGDLDAARIHSAASLHGVGTAPTRFRAIALNTAARLSHLCGDPEGALAHLNAALEVTRQIRDLGLRKAFLTNLVQLATESGELEAALAALHEGLDLVQASGDRRGEGGFEHRLGDVQRLRGRLGAAARAYTTAIEIADALGQHDQQAVRRLHLARLWGALNHLEGMRALLAELEGFGDAQTAQRAVEEARLAWLSGDAAGAAQRLHSVLESPALNAPAEREPALALLGEVLLDLQDPQGALTAVQFTPATPAAQAAFLAVRLRVPGPVPESDLQAARALLASERLPPLEALALRQALTALPGAPPDPDEAPLLARLRATLPGELHHAFLERWSPSGVPA